MKKDHLLFVSISIHIAVIYSVSHPIGILKCVLPRCWFGNLACAVEETLFSRFRAVISRGLFHMVRVDVYWFKIVVIYASALAEQMK